MDNQSISPSTNSPWHESVVGTLTGLTVGVKYLVGIRARISTKGSGNYGQWIRLRAGEGTSGAIVAEAGAWGRFDQVFSDTRIIEAITSTLAFTAQADDNSQAEFSSYHAYAVRLG